MSELDIQRLAGEFGIEARLIRNTIKEAKELMAAVRSNVRPADKKALRSLTKSLEEILDRLRDETVRERLVDALFKDLGGAVENEYSYERGMIWWRARQRLGKAIQGTEDLLEIVRCSNATELPAGRPRYEALTAGAIAIMGLWQTDLNHKITISDHPNDSRGVKPSDALRFTYECLTLAGEKVTLQACRTVLQNLKSGKVETYNRNYSNG